MRRLGLIGLLLAVAACHSAPSPTRRLAILTVDGLDPAIVTRLVEDGRLPHLAELARQSGIVHVRATPGAESASAWSSVVTGVGPGAHGVFDLVAPDPDTGRPTAATLRRRASARWFGSVWREGPAFDRARGGLPFWARLADGRLRSRVLFVPGTFPPEPFDGGSIIAGSPLPDWSGALGTGYTWLASDVRPDEVGPTRHGGRLERLVFTRNVAHATLVGIRAPERIDVPLTVAWSPENRSANITIGDESVHLTEGQQSRWITIGIRLNPLKRVQGLVRVLLVSAGNDVRLMVSAIQWHPVSPPSAIAAPPGAAPTLFARIGPFRTLSWPEAGWAFADGRLTRDLFEAAQDETFADRSAALLSQAELGDWDLLVAGVETLEATTQLLWRRSDAGVPANEAEASGAIVRAYQQLDALVGDLRGRLPAGTAVVVMSAYGQARATRIVDLNRWLTDRGWLVWSETPGAVTYAALAEPAAWRDTVDWSRTVARAMGSGHIYLNRRSPAASANAAEAVDAEHRVTDIRTALEALTDPLSGRHVAARVRTAREAYGEPRSPNAPDLVVTWVPGYRGSTDTMLGGVAEAAIATNGEPWLAAHSGVDEEAVPGVWLSTVPLRSDTISVMDVAPTVMEFFGHVLPADVEGRSQLRDRPSSTSRR